MKIFSLFFTTMICGALLSCSDSTTVSPKADDPGAAPVDEALSSGQLAGQFRNAGANSPIVLIVPGSGPTDLNGNNPMGVNSNTYKLLAEALANKGISSVRVDKRGMFSSAAAGDPNAVTVDIYAHDYSDWVDTIRTKTNAQCVYMLGHSEGALMVSAASIINSNVCGLILVSGMGRPFGDVLREQLKANPANKPLLDDALKAITQLEQGQKVDVDKFHPALKALFAPAVQDFLISEMQVDPAQVAAEAQKRTLIIQGATDLQTSVLDAEKLAQATQGKLVVVDGVNHILKEAPMDRQQNFKTYTNPKLPISTDVVDAIAQFVLP